MILTTGSIPALTAGDRDNEALSAVLDRIPREGVEYGPWWGTDEGQELLASIKRRLGNPIVRGVLNLYGAKYDTDDVAHTAIEVLARSSTAEAVQYANNPWGYLYSVLRRELIHQVGPFFRSSSELEHLVTADPADRYTGRVTDMETAVTLTSSVVAGFTPPAAREHLDDVVHYVANRSGSRLSRACTEITQDPYLDQYGYTARELRSITNIVLGSRPKFAETSILAGFVGDVEWVPARSDTHLAALRRYQSRMEHTVAARPTLKAA